MVYDDEVSSHFARLGFETDEPGGATKAQWEQAQRDVVTTTLDFTLDQISRMVERGDLELNPVYQRRQRWDQVRRSRLIESFLMNIPTPPIFLNEDDYGRYSLIDGRK